MEQRLFEIKLNLVKNSPILNQFVSRDTLQDLIYLVELEGISGYYENDKALQNDMITKYKLYGMKALDLDEATFQREIYPIGIRRLEEFAKKCNPLDRTSIIFEHKSNDIHRETQKIHIELIKNEPEVQERSTIVCACGSGRVRTAAVQTRRADEPLTIFAQCTVCRLKWKIY